MIVEFQGPPGSGKSHVVNELCELFDSQGIATSQPQEFVRPGIGGARRATRLAILVLKECVLAPRETVSTAVLIARGQQGMRNRIGRPVTWTVVRGLFRRARKHHDAIHLFDQGILQELASISFEGLPLPISYADPGAARLGPDVLVTVEAEPKLCESRLLNRPHKESRIERTESDVGNALETFEEQARSLRTEWLELHQHSLCAEPLSFDNGQNICFQKNIVLLGDRIVNLCRTQ
ncbi:MAG: hypothetical protein ACI8Y4_004466 [Candidatus Poriferisodalaceae bacterium]|jgi:hypothetical protein